MASLFFTAPGLQSLMNAPTHLPTYLSICEYELLLYLNNKHVLSFSLKVHYPLPLVDTQRLLLGAHCISPVQDNEDICVCAGSKHVTREDFNLIRNNYKNK